MVTSYIITVAWLSDVGTLYMCSVVQSCPPLCNPLDCSPRAPLSMGFSRQEYWSGCHFPHQGIFPTQAWNLHLLCLLQLNYSGSPILVTKIQEGLTQISLVLGFALLGGGVVFMKFLWNFITGTNMYTNQLFNHQKEASRAFPGVQWLRLWASTAGVGFAPWMGN